MRKPHIFLLTLLALSVSALAKPAVGDWQVVKEELPRGWQITVVTQFAFPCIFEQANNEELICQPLRRDRLDSDSREIHVRRERIREIRVERQDGANMLAGAAGAGAAAAGFGAIAASGARGRSAYFFGLLGAPLGARYGRDVHILRGKVIYRRP
jgi:hypothetical protein